MGERSRDLADLYRRHVPDAVRLAYLLTGDGEVAKDVSPKAANDAVKKPDASGKSTNALEVRVAADKIDYVVNGTVVNSTPKSAVARTDGTYGIRVNHQLEVHIDGLAVSK